MNFPDYELVSDGKILQTLTIKIISLYILRSLLNRSAIKRASSLNAIVTIVKRASSFNRDLRVPTYFSQKQTQIHSRPGGTYGDGWDLSQAFVRQALCSQYAHMKVFTTNSMVGYSTLIIDSFSL